MKEWLFAIGLLLVLHPFWATAQVNETEEVHGSVHAGKIVVTATITEKSLEEAPGSIEVLTEQEIKEVGATTAAEALEWAAGLVVAGETGRARVPNIRGTGNKRTLVLVDGRRLAMGYKDLIDINQIPVTMIHRIEVVRGPSSAIYGSDAMGGVVNIITKKTPQNPVAGATGRYGNHFDGNGEAYDGSVYGGTRLGRFGFLLSGGYRDKEGWDEDGTLPDDGDQERLGSAAGRFSLDLADAHTLSTGFEYSDMQRDGDRFYQGLERERQAEDRRLGYFLQYDADLKPARHLMLRAYRSEHENEIGFSPAAGVSAEEDAERYLNQLETQFTSPIFQRHILSMGAEFRTEGRKDATGREDDLDNASIYLQDEYQVFDPLYLVLGLRYDDHSEFGDHYTPRASLIYNLNPKLRFKASYGKGFRAPSLSELFVTSYRQRGRYIYDPNPDLDPEESESYEVGIEGEIGPLRAGVTAFKNEIEDMIEAVFVRSTGSGNQTRRYYRHENIAEATTQGLEIEGGLQLPLNFALRGHLTCLDTQNEETGEDLEGQPDFKGSIKLEYHQPDLGFRANIRIDHMGVKYYAVGEEDAYTLVNFYFSKDLGDHFNMFAGIDNLFDEQEDRDGVSIIEPVSYYAGIRINY